MDFEDIHSKNFLRTATNDRLWDSSTPEFTKNQVLETGASGDDRISWRITAWRLRIASFARPVFARLGAAIYD
ncbi:hypothetical protein LBMAG46_32600 [Planctomycetia bacterium]|nr:hypothetical protein LBMAG46_32600 [Planctomycetia bacterium]